MNGLGRRLGPMLWRRAARLRNAGFRSRITADKGAPAVVLSPHFDDAVLDCWSVLRGHEPVQVVNVFAGVPAEGSVAHWDRIAGALDSATRVRSRIEEDRRALAQAGRIPVNLAFLADPYREGRAPPSFRQIDEAVAAVAPTMSGVHAPAALGVVHPDHALVRSYALALSRQGLPVRLFADLPYSASYGWPAWVTGKDADPHLDVDAFWELSSSGSPVRFTRAGADVVCLTAEEASAKLAAMRTYSTQFPTLDRGPVGLLSNPLIHRYEVFWPVGG